MRQWLVGKFKTRVIPRPAGWIEDNYPRFVIANGLSNRELQLRHNWRLPTDIPGPPDAAAGLENAYRVPELQRLRLRLCASCSLAFTKVSLRASLRTPLRVLRHRPPS